jgi:hypothetical protein
MVDLERLLPALSGAGVEFIIVGGVAAIVHGSARLTQDLDVVYRRDPENVDSLAAALQPFQPYLRGAPPGLPFRWDPETIRRGLNFTLTTSAGPLDVLGEIAGGGTYETLLPHPQQEPHPQGTAGRRQRDQRHGHDLLDQAEGVSRIAKPRRSRAPSPGPPRGTSVFKEQPHRPGERARLPHAHATR